MEIKLLPLLTFSVLIFTVGYFLGYVMRGIKGD
jgi:hypothetical protein